MNKEKKEYLPAELLLINFDNTDVIQTSIVIEPGDDSWV